MAEKSGDKVSTFGDSSVTRGVLSTVASKSQRLIRFHHCLVEGDYKTRSASGQPWHEHNSGSDSKSASGLQSARDQVVLGAARRSNSEVVPPTRLSEGQIRHCPALPMLQDVVTIGATCKLNYWPHMSGPMSLCMQVLSE